MPTTPDVVLVLITAPCILVLSILTAKFWSLRSAIAIRERCPTITVCCCAFLLATTTLTLTHIILPAGSLPCIIILIQVEITPVALGVTMIFRAVVVWHRLALGRTSLNPSSEEHQKLIKMEPYVQPRSSIRWFLSAALFSALHTAFILVSYPQDYAPGATPCSTFRRPLPNLLLPGPYLSSVGVLFMRFRHETNDDLGLMQELKLLLLAFNTLAPIIVLMALYEFGGGFMDPLFTSWLHPDIFYAWNMLSFAAVLVAYPLRIHSQRMQHASFLGGSFALGSRVAALHAAVASLNLQHGSTTTPQQPEPSSRGWLGTENTASRSAITRHVDINDLVSVIGSPLTRPYLHRFMERCWCSESLLFVMAVRNLKARHSEQPQEQATTKPGPSRRRHLSAAVHPGMAKNMAALLNSECKTLYLQYIHPHGELAVNLRYETSRAIHVRANAQDFTVDMFDTAEAEVIQIVAADVYPRFLVSPECDELKREQAPTLLLSAGDDGTKLQEQSP